MIVPLRYQLRNGDTIEIITSPNQKPNKDWLKLVKTARARTKIRYLLRTGAARQGGRARHRPARQGAAQARHHARARREAAQARGAGAAVRDRRRADRPGRLRQDHRAAGAREGAARAREEGASERRAEDREHAEDAAAQGHAPHDVDAASRSPARTTSSSGSRSAASPLPGDPIVGFITRGRGVTVHRRDCDKGLDLDPERRIDVEWDGNGKAQHEVAIQVLCADKPGLLAHISQSFTDQGVNISQAHCRATEDGRAVNTFHASVTRSRSAQAGDPLAVADQGRVLGRSRLRRPGLRDRAASVGSSASHRGRLRDYPGAERLVR